jgi:hypothetical protein
MFLGWNGAAGKDRIPSQFPFLISGGLGGLAIVVIGAGLIIVQNHRVDRAALQATLTDIKKALELVAAAGGPPNGHTEPGARGESAPGEVVAGPTAYHRPDCRLVQGREGLASLTVAAAEVRGLAPCRVCDAGASVPGEPSFAPPASEAAPGGPSLRRRS